MFLGRFEHTIDAKSRVSIPVKFREVLADKYDDKLVVTVDFDRCLVIYPIDEWRQLEEKTRNLPAMQNEIKDFLRFFYSAAEECALDRQGRLLVPPRLREYARLEREVILVGMMTKFELWDVRRWREKEGQMSQSFDKISAALAQHGL